MELEEILQAVKEGKTVCWKKDIYKVIPHEGGPMIKCTLNGHLIGLTHRDGKTMNGDPEDFYIKEEPKKLTITFECLEEDVNNIKGFDHYEDQSDRKLQSTKIATFLMRTDSFKWINVKKVEPINQ